MYIALVALISIVIGCLYASLMVLVFRLSVGSEYWGVIFGSSRGEDTPSRNPALCEPHVKGKTIDEFYASCLEAAKNGEDVRFALRSFALCADRSKDMQKYNDIANKLVWYVIQRDFGARNAFELTTMLDLYGDENLLLPRSLYTDIAQLMTSWSEDDRNFLEPKVRRVVSSQVVSE